MARKIQKQDLPNITPGEVVGIINGGIELVGAAAPVLKVLFDKVNDWISSLGNKANSPAGRLRRIEALEAQNKLQKEQNKLLEARLEALEAKG